MRVKGPLHKGKILSEEVREPDPLREGEGLEAFGNKSEKRPERSHGANHSAAIASTLTLP